MRCPDCQAECPSGAVACMHCGASLDPPAAIVTEERKVVSILFADIRGSLNLIRGRDPEEARRLLSPTVALMADAVRRFDGTVVRTLGDGIMALFGAPQAQEDHAVRACHAALAMRNAAAAVSAEGKGQQGGVAIRVGVNSGEVLFRESRFGTTMDFEADGEVVHLAARMEQTARPGTVRVTDATLHLAKGQVVVDPLGKVRVKGLAGPIAAFELLAVGLDAPRPVAASGRNLTPFVGRSAEMKVLDKALRSVTEGRGEAIALIGEPGCGKSRIVYETTVRARAFGFVVLDAWCVPYGRRSSYLPLQSMCRRLFGIAEDDDAATIRERLGCRLALGAKDAAEAAAAIAAITALVDSGAAADPAWRGLAPEVRRRRLFEGIRTLLSSEGRHQPLMLVVEDLHWADRETLAVLSWLMEQLPGMRMLLLTDFRPEHGHNWSRFGHWTGMDVLPLAGEEAWLLTSALLGRDGVDGPLGLFLTERAGGNPFFAEEIVEALAEQGLLSGERGAWSCAIPLDVPGVPATVRAVLAARVDRLTSEDKRLLQAAAVIGKDFAVPLLAEITDLAPGDLHSTLDRLFAAQFLRHLGDENCTFRHALTHEVVYAGVPLAQRHRMHGQIVDAIERLHVGRLAEHAEALSRHAGIARRWDAVLLHARQAGITAVARSANRDAVAFFEQALAALQEVPETDAGRRLAVDIRFEIREPLFRLGMLRRVVLRLREAEPLAAQLGDQMRLGQLAILLSHILWTAGDHAGATEEALRAEAMARDYGDRALGWRARFQLGCAWMARGEFTAAVKAMDAVAAALRDDTTLWGRYGLDPALAAVARCYAARALADLGEFSAAAKATVECARLADAVGKPFTRIYAEFAAGYLALSRADPHTAMQHFKGMLAFAHEAEATLNIPVAMALLAEASICAGVPVDTVIGALREAVRSASEMGLLLHQPARLAWLAEASSRSGVDAKEANRIARRALRTAERQGERGAAAQATRTLGVIAAAQGSVAMAQVHYRRAAQRAAALGMRPFIALCHLELSELLAGSASPAETAGALDIAATLCDELGLAAWTARINDLRLRYATTVAHPEKVDMTRRGSPSACLAVEQPTSCIRQNSAEM